MSPWRKCLGRCTHVALKNGGDKACPKATETNLEGLLLPKSGVHWGSKENDRMAFNPLNNLGIHESLLMERRNSCGIRREAPAQCESVDLSNTTEIAVAMMGSGTHQHHVLPNRAWASPASTAPLLMLDS